MSFLVNNPFLGVLDILLLSQPVSTSVLGSVSYISLTRSLLRCQGDDHWLLYTTTPQSMVWESGLFESRGSVGREVFYGRSCVLGQVLVLVRIRRFTPSDSMTLPQSTLPLSLKSCSFYRPTKNPSERYTTPSSGGREWGVGGVVLVNGQ